MLKMLPVWANPDGEAGFGNTTVLNVHLKMLKHSEQNQMCVLHPANFSRKKQLFFSRLNEESKAWSPHWSCLQHC